MVRLQSPILRSLDPPGTGEFNDGQDGMLLRFSFHVFDIGMTSDGRFWALWPGRIPTRMLLWRRSGVTAIGGLHWGSLEKNLTPRRFVLRPAWILYLERGCLNSLNTAVAVYSSHMILRFRIHGTVFALTPKHLKQNCSTVLYLDPRWAIVSLFFLT